MNWRAQFVRSADGTRIAYGVEGDGPPILYLGPAGWSHVELYPRQPDGQTLMRELLQYYRVIRIDLRGTGMSDRDILDHSPEALLSDVEAVLSVLGIERLDVFASVIRVSVAVRLAVSTSRVRRMVLSSPFLAGDPAAPGILPLIEGNFEQFITLMARGVGRSLKARTDFMRQCLDSANAAAEIRASRPLEDWELAARVTCPVLIVDDKGSLARPGHTESLAARFRRSQLIATDTYHPFEFPQAIHDFLRAPDETGPSATMARLSRREAEILTLLARGLTQREIAGALVLSPATVSRHVTELYRKIGVHRRADAVRWALEHGAG